VFRATVDTSTTSNTVRSAITGMLFTVRANTTYHFKFHIYCTAAAATTGVRISVNGPAGLTALRMGGLCANSTTAFFSGVVTAINTDILTTGSGGATATMQLISGTVRVGSTDGTIQAQVISEVSASNVTVLTDSWGQVIEAP